MDVHLRRLRYFVAVAEELHFTRAAARVHVAQPSLSKQVRLLEEELGFPLFERNTRSVVLTQAGMSLVPAAQAVLEQWQLGVREAAAVHTRESRVLRVGFVASGANEWTPSIVAAFARTRPGWRVDLTQAPWSDPTAGLGSGTVDAAFLRLPIPGYDDSVAVEELLTEPRYVAMAAGHRLAVRDRVPFHELLEEPFVATPVASGGWRDYWLATAERDGHPPRIGAVVTSPDEWLEAITNGRGVSLTPEASARFYARPGIVYRPVDGVSPSTVAICWRRGEGRAVVRDFVHACRTVVDGPSSGRIPRRS
jgi:DNA-binding transcriptional LysR family regulator